MKVMRITTSLDFGGIEKVFELHAKYLDKSDYDIIFVALDYGGITSRLLEELGFPVIILNCKSKIPSLICFSKLFKLIREQRPDVVHTCGAEANFHGQIIAKVIGVKRRVAEEIGLPEHSKRAQFIFRSIYRFSNAVIGISEAVKKYLIKYEVRPDKVFKIYNPIDIDSKEEQQVKCAGGDKYIISTLCRLEPVKNCKALIDLLIVLKGNKPNKNFELWFVGDGSEREKLERYVKECALSDSVKFFGFSAHPKSILKQTSLFILPSLKEGFGLACIEAIQCGLPVIVSNSGGMREYIEDGVNGFLFSPENLIELVSKVEILLSMSHEQVLNMTSQARITVDKLFSPMRYLYELKHVYTSIPEKKQSLKIT